MGEKYPDGKWCKLYNCFCDDVEDITNGNNNCYGECCGCAFCSEVNQDEF